MPSKPGTNRCEATSPASGFAQKISNPKQSRTTPASAAITASSRRKPRCWRARIPNAPAPAINAAGKSGIPNSRLRPSAAPTTSATSQAIATTSAWSQRPIDERREKVSRQSSGRFLPVAIPSLADCVWISIAIRFAATTTQSSRYPNWAPALMLVAKLPGSM